MTDQIKSVYFGNLTAKRGDDGFMYVKGLATDDTLDLDEQICDPSWLAKAMPAWFEIGNIREMHQSKAVGKAMEMQQTGTGFVIEAKIVDPQAAKMVDEGIYTGFSVGIKNARVVKDAKAPGGRISSGQIVEVSLVDRPANPSCTLELAKSAGGEVVKGAAMIEKAESPTLNAEAIMSEEPGVAGEVLNRDQPQPCQSCAGTGKKTNVEGNTQETPCDVCDGSGHQPEGRIENATIDNQTIPQDRPNRDMKDAEPDLAKKDYSDAERKQMASRGQAMPGGGFPIKSVEDLKNAIQSIGRAKNRAASIAHIKARAKALGQESLIPDEWKAVDADLVKFVTDLAKASSDDQWLHDPAQLSSIRDGLVSVIKAELDEYATGDDETVDIMQLTGALNAFLCWWENEATEGETAAPFDQSKDDTMAYVQLGVSADLIKSASADDATDEVKSELRTEIVKALGLEGAITTKTALDEAKEQIELLKAALDDVKAMAAPGGPALRATQAQTQKSATVLANEVEASRLRNVAAQLTDPAMRNQFLDTARALEAQNSNY